MGDLVFLVCTFILSTSCAVYFVISRKLMKAQSFILLFIMINISITAASDIVSNYIENTTIARGGLFTLQYGTQLLFFIFHATLAPLYAIYVMMVNGIGLNKNRNYYLPFLAPLILAEILLIINPFTCWIFYYNGNANFERGPYEYLIYGVAGFYIILALYQMVKYRTAVSRSTNITLWYFFSFTLIGILIQLINSEIKIELFSETVSMLGVMLSIENDAANLDSSTGAYNRQAFMTENTRLLRTGHRYGIISISLTNTRFYNRILSYNSILNLFSTMADWFMSLSKQIRVYRVTPDNFSLIYLYENPEDVEMITDTIASKFKEGWIYEDTKIEFNTIIRIAMIPQEFADPDLILEISEENVNTEQNGVLVLKGEDLETITRRVLIEHAMRNALDNKSFQVYYQPIWNAETKKITTAEALIRLIDPAIGFISPEEFIPIAEQNGLISEIGLIVFEKVCAFLADERTKALGLHYIEVNLSIFQLLVGNTIEEFKKIMKKYGITSDQINLEITETGSFSNSNSLINAIDSLKELGFEFSLDDYGTGYSNLTYIISMDFLNIKSDKGLLWDSDHNENSKILLIDTIKMMRRLGFNVIQEGVETKAQLNLVVDAGANLIQGYYFSKPVPEDEFLKFVENFEYQE